MATLEDIMLTISATDNASGVFRGVGSNAQSMASTATQAINSMNAGFANLNQASNNLMSSLSNGKSASELIFATTSKAETNNVLLSMMSDTQEAAEKLYKRVDTVTDGSLVSMQNLIPALNAFKSATGATDQQISDATEDIANFGAKVLAQTGSVVLSEQAMMDLSKGIKGACASLDQYGITTDALKRTGLWSGEESDIQGYMAAVRELIGDSSELLETNEGLDAKLGKAFSSAGKQIGNTFLPQIRDVKQAFLDLNSASDGTLAAGILVAAEGVDIFSQGMMFAAQTSQGIKGIKDGFETAGDAIKEANEWLNKFRASEEAVSALQYSDAIGPLPVNVAQSTTQYAAGATDVLQAGGIDNILDAMNSNISKDELTKAEKLLKNNDKEIHQFAKLIEQHNNSLDDALEVYKKTGDLSKYEKDVKAINKEKDQLFKYIEEFGEISPLVENMDFDVPDIGKMDKFNKTAELMDDIGDVKDFTKVTETTEEVVESASSMGKVGPKAAVAGAEMEASAGGLSAISAGVSSMLVPLLTIAVVVAVMIPVVTALAAEAILCMKGLQLLVDTLNFGSVDLSDDVDGIKQIGDVLLNIGIAMGEMTFATIMTGAYTMASGLFFVANPVQVAVDQLKEVIPIVNELSEVEPVDESIPSKLEAFSKSMKLTSDAMNSMTTVTGAVAWSNFIAWASQLGSVSNAISQAKDDIVKAANEISTIKDLPEIDDNALAKLESASKSLKSTAEAVGAIGDLNWAEGVSNIFDGPIFNGGDIAATLTEVKSDLWTAAQALREFKDMPAIPEGTGTKLKNVADSLKSTSDAISALGDINWDVGTGKILNGALFNGGDSIRTIREVKTQLWNVASELRSLNDMPAIPEGTGSKIQRVVWVLNDVNTAINTLNTVQGATLTNDFSSITSTMGNVKSTLFQVSARLRELADISNIPEGTGNKIQRVSWTTNTVMSAIQTLNNVQNTQINASNIVSTITNARVTLFQVSARLREINDISNIPEGVGSKIQRVAWTANTVASAVTSIRSVPQVDTTSSNKIQNAVKVINSSITELNKLKGNVNNVSGVLSSVRNTMNQLRATLSSMRGSFTASSTGIGSGIKSGVINGMSGLSGEVNAQATAAMSLFSSTMTTGGTNAGNNAKNAFQSSFKLAAIARAEMNYAVQAVNSGAGALAEACRKAAEDAVEAARDGAESHSPGAIARMWGQEIGEYSVQKVLNGASLLVRTIRNVSRNVVNAWGSPSLDIGTNLGMLSNFNPGNLQNMNLLSRIMPVNGSQDKTIIFNIEKGAWQLDARNLTERECQKIVTLGLEGLTQISDVNIRGI